MKLDTDTLNDNRKAILACHELLIRSAKTPKRRKFYEDKRDEWLAGVAKRTQPSLTPSFINRFAEQLTTEG